MEGLSKKEKEVMDMDKSGVIAGRGSMRGLNDYEKYTFFFFKEMPLEMASVGPASWVGQGLKKSEGRANSVSQVAKVSDLVSACQLSEKKGPEKNNGLCQHFCQGERYFSSSQLISDNSVLPCMSLVPQCWSSSK